MFPVQIQELMPPVDRIDAINAFLRQGIDEVSHPDTMLEMLEEAIGGIT